MVPKYRPGCIHIISPPEQWTGGSMYKVCETQNQEMQNFVLFQIRSTHIGVGTPSPAMPLFNRSIRVLLPQTGREPTKMTKMMSFVKP